MLLGDIYTRNADKLSRDTRCQNILRTKNTNISRFLLHTCLFLHTFYTNTFAKNIIEILHTFHTYESRLIIFAHFLH